MSLSPAVTARPSVTVVCGELPPWAPPCCTNAGTTAELGITLFDGADAGEVPTAFVAVTVKVYETPFVRPVIVAPVGAGLPVTVLEASGVPPVHGVTVYEVMVEPPLFGAFHVTLAEAFPAEAVTPVGAAGAFGAGATCTVAAREGTPLPLTMKSM
jgi:hypothetical protein